MSAQPQSAPLRLAVYARVSKKNRHGQTTSVDQQIDHFREAAPKHDAVIVAEFADRAVKASGEAKRRDDWEALLDLIKSDGCDLVALWETSRSSRRLDEWAQFRRLCGEHFVNWLTPDGIVYPNGKDRLVSGIKAVVAEEEIAQLSARLRRDIASKAAEGRPHGREIYGYRRIYSSGTGALIGVEVEPSEVAVVRELVEGVLAGKGLRTLGRDLDDRGVLCPSDAIAVRRGREPKGYHWTGRVIRDLLVRKAYLGIREHTTRQERTLKAAEYRAVWPAIITAEEHRRLGALLSDPARWTRTDDGGQPVVTHWLTGTLRCGKCQGSMRRYKQTTGVEAYACADPRCRGCSVNLAVAEAVVEKVVLARLSRDDAAEALLPPVAGGEDTTAKARAEVETAEAKQAELDQAFAAGILPLAAYAGASRLVAAQVEAARAALRTAKAPGLPKFAREAHDPAAAWQAWAPAQRHEVARALFDRIIVKPLGRSGRPRKDVPAETVMLSRLGFVRVGTVGPDTIIA